MGCASTPTLPPGPHFLFDNITIEIQPTEDFDIVAIELAKFKDRLDFYRICKPFGVNFVVRTPVLAHTLLWTRRMIIDFQDNHRTLSEDDSDDRHLVLFMSLLPGKYVTGEPNNIIGLAIGGEEYIVMLQNRFHNATLLHEIGHIIGLVDRTKREGPPVNPDRPNHCNNNHCVMFWRVNKGGSLDDNCVKDLQEMIKNSLKKFF